MRVVYAALAVPLLLVLMLLTWLLVRGINTDAERFDRTLATLDEFLMANSALGRDVLAARAGLLRNYDPLVEEIRELYDCLDRLREAGASDPEIANALDQ